MSVQLLISDAKNEYFQDHFIKALKYFCDAKRIKTLILEMHVKSFKDHSMLLWKLKIHLPYGPATALLDMCSREVKIYSQRNLYTNVLFINS